MLFDDSARLQVLTVTIAFAVLSVIGFVLQKTQVRTAPHTPNSGAQA